MVGVVAGSSLNGTWITGEANGFPRPFGPYLLLAGLAQGGMGELMLAMNGSIAGAFRLCVVKKLRADLTNDKEYVNRFVDEAKVVVQLNHANVSHVFDIGRIEGQYYLAMEYVSGISVKRLMARAAELDTTIPEDVALYIARGVLEALDYAHQHTHPFSGEPLHVVHRDVSPQNVLVSWAGEIKLIDFGLALSAMKDEHTATGAVMGKIAYMPPEQARGEDVGPACDQFAAAVVTYEMLVGERYHGDLPMHGIWAIAGMGNFPPPSWNKLPRELQIIMERALRNDPYARYPTCGDFREALGAYMAAHHSATGGRQLRDLLDAWLKDYRTEERGLLAQFKDVTGSKVREAVKGSASAAESLASGQYQRPKGWEMPPTEPDARALSLSGKASSGPAGSAVPDAGVVVGDAGLERRNHDDSRSLRFMPPPSVDGPASGLEDAAAALLAPPTTGTEEVLAAHADAFDAPRTPAGAGARPAAARVPSRPAFAVAASAARPNLGRDEATERLARARDDDDDDELDFDPARQRPRWPWVVVAAGAVVGVVIALATPSEQPDTTDPPAHLVDDAPTPPTSGAPNPSDVPPLAPPAAEPVDEAVGRPEVAFAPRSGPKSANGRGTGKATGSSQGPRDRGEPTAPEERPELVEPEPSANVDREIARTREHVDALRRSSCQDPCVARIVGQLETTPGAVELEGFRKSIGACIQACL